MLYTEISQWHCAIPNSHVLKIVLATCQILKIPKYVRYFICELVKTGDGTRIEYYNDDNTIQVPKDIII